MSVDIVNFLQALKKRLIMSSLEQSISATIEGNAIYIIYVSELEILTVLTYHCAGYSVWPGPFLIVLYLALNAESLGTPDLQVRECILKKVVSGSKSKQFGFLQQN